jgi:hypothetical protein
VGHAHVPRVSPSPAAHGATAVRCVVEGGDVLPDGSAAVSGTASLGDSGR